MTKKNPGIKLDDDDGTLDDESWLPKGGYPEVAGRTSTGLLEVA